MFRQSALALGALAMVFSVVQSTVSTSAQAAPARTAAARARAAEFARKVDVLSQMAYAFEIHKHLKGANAEEMIIALGMVRRGESRPEFMDSFTVEATDWAFGDQVGWGTLRTLEAQNLFMSGDGSDLKKEEIRSKLGAQIIKELAAMGAKFGYTDGSSSYCGVSFMGLLIVDEETGTIFELSLTDGGTC